MRTICNYFHRLYLTRHDLQFRAGMGNCGPPHVVQLQVIASLTLSHSGCKLLISAISAGSQALHPDLELTCPSPSNGFHVLSMVKKEKVKQVPAMLSNRSQNLCPLRISAALLVKSSVNCSSELSQLAGGSKRLLVSLQDLLSATK